MKFSEPGQPMVSIFMLLILISCESNKLSSVSTSLFFFFPQQSFTLEFHFEPNGYFNNAVLTKVYKMKAEPDALDPFSFEGPEIIDCEG